MEVLPRRQLLLKFLASLMLLGFLVGLMLGQLQQPQETYIAKNRVEQLIRYADGLRVCLHEPSLIQAASIQGSYQLLLTRTAGQPARGELTLANDQPVRWQLKPQNNAMQLSFVGLQPLVGQWQEQASAEHWCIDIKLSLDASSER